MIRFDAILNHDNFNSEDMYQHVSIDLQQALCQSKAANHRALLILSGARGACWALLEELLREIELATILSYRSPENCPVNSHRLKRASEFLGTNNDCVIFDAWGGFDPDAFGIISGSVNGGGLAILITPALPKWPNFVDPENKRLAVHPRQASDVSGYYLRRISRIIATDLPNPQTCNNVEVRLLITQSISSTQPQPLPNHEQINVIGAIEHLVSHSKTGNPMLITADRGRGKSTALGLAATKLLNAGVITNIIVTAPGKPSLSSFFQHVDSTLEKTTSSRPVFVATDRLVMERPIAALLIIDEAAAIPLPALLKLIETYPHCVLSSTLHGYEGSGRGFALRLRSLLEIHYPGWQEKRLTCPTRFATGDPLEEFTARLLMLDATNAVFNVNPILDKNECRLEQLSASALAQDEEKLAELFALLVQAHYQTKPLDLKHLLDGPNLRIFVLTHEGRIVAAVLLAKEQLADDTALQEAIIHGERRPRGHLLSQQLAYQNLEAEYLDLKIARVVRIAVLPQLQKQSLGSYLLDKVFQYCNSESFDAIGASFGATDELLNFWNKNHYRTLHLGYRLNASSASYSAVVFQGISQHAKSLSNSSLNNFLRTLEFRRNNTQGVAMVDSILRRLIVSDRESQPCFNKAVVASYAYRHRDFESSHAELHHYLLNINLTGITLPTIQQQALKSIILQRKNWDSVSKTLKLQGRKDCETLLRAALREIQEQL